MCVQCWGDEFACKRFMADSIEFLVNPMLLIPIYNKLALNVIFRQIYCRQRLWRDRAVKGKNLESV